MLRKLFIAGVGLTAAGSAVALDLNYAGTDYGTFIGRVRAMSILAAEENGWDPSSGNSYSLMGRYISPTWNGFSFAAAAYLNGDIFGTTDFDPEVGKERTARGMFLADEGEQKGQLNAVGVTYRSENVYAFAGRDQIDTPLTKNTYNHVPNSYTALRVGAKPIKGLDISLSQITQMSFGTRAMTDFGFIGEATGTAGAAQLPSQDGLGQAEFLNLGQIALGPNADDIAGLTVASVVYSGLPNTKVGLWNFYTDDIANSVYLDIDAKIPLEGMKLDLGAQYLRQDDVGDGTRGIHGASSTAIRANFGDGDLDYNLIGLKAGLIGPKKKWTAHAMYNHSSGDTAFFNAFGGDPAYTGSIFSRNAYRENVDAWGVRGSYEIIPGLRFMAAWFDYGQSETLGAVPNVTPLARPTSDATELDLVLDYKPKQIKGLGLRLFYVNRTSEYDGFVNPVSGNKADATMSHVRLIATYMF
ncbi:MAG: OprD family outer membrane porin [Thiohalocapsa sp.]|nr:OprD family outer membrane porin [Thiohalocapsa sp.]